MTFRVMAYNIGGAHGENLWPVKSVLGEINPKAALLVEARGGVAGWLEMQLHPRTNMRAMADPTDIRGKLAWLHACDCVDFPFARSTKRVSALRMAEENSQITLFGIHLPHGGHTWSEQRRERILRTILAAITKSQPGPHLILGDFNSVDLGRRVLRKYTDCYEYLHPHEPGLTYIGMIPGSRIDRIYASPELIGRLKRCEVVLEAPREPSPPFDHLPVWAEFA